MQLVSGLVWKQGYAEYLEANPASKFEEDTLKDILKEALKDFEDRNKQCRE